MANGILQGAGNFFGDIVTAIQPGRTQQLQLQRDKIESFLKTDEMRRKLLEVQKEAIESGRTMTGATPRGSRVGGTAAEKTLFEQHVEKSKRLNAAEKVLKGEGELSPEKKVFIDEKKARLNDEFNLNFAQDPIDRDLKAAGGRAALPRTTPKGGMTDRISADLVSPPPKDRRGLFSGEDVAFDNIGLPSSPTATPGLFQAPTPDFPESNVPLSFGEMGLTAKDDIAQFSELEKGLPDMDLRSQYQANQQGFAKILSALKAGKTPDGKPFTIKDAIKFLQANQ